MDTERTDLKIFSLSSQEFSHKPMVTGNQFRNQMTAVSMIHGSRVMSLFMSEKL